MRTQQPAHNAAGSASHSHSNQLQQSPQSNIMTNPQSPSQLAFPSTSLGFQQLQYLQKTLGNRAVSQLMQQGTQQLSGQQPTASLGTSQSVIQRVSDNKDHHQQFLHERVNGTGVDTSSDSDFLLAEACAYVLDHNSYEQAHTNLPLKYAAIVGSVPGSGNAQDYLNIVQSYIQSLGQQTSIMEWDSLTALGTGQGARARYAPAGHAEGTPTSRLTPWMEILKSRRDGDKTLYVMGHLINADLGGPGLDYNYVPLPGRGGWYGANDANGIHSKGMEQIVKAKYELLGEEVTNLEYYVDAIYPREARNTQINEIAHAISEMAVIEAELDDDADTVLRQFTVEYKDILKQQIQAVPNLEPMLYAVSSNNYWAKSWANLRGLLEENLQLWKQEDQLVPKQLNTVLKWEQRGVKEELALTVPIELPDRVDAPYNSKKSIKYKKVAPSDHKSQFKDFLEKNTNIVQDDSGEAVDARVAAFLMDRNEYDREQIKDLIENLFRLHELHEQLSQDGLTDEQREQIQIEMQSLDLANDLLASDPALAQILKDLNVVPLLNAQLNMSSGELFDKVLNYAKNDHITRGTGRIFSEFTYSGQTPWGSPSKVVAHLQKNGHPQGSSADGDSEWMLNLEERRDQAKTLYVRGHMLNRHLGGAGLDSNMVPLTGREGWYGANNANGLHSGMIEEKVKYLYSMLAEQGEEHDANKVTDLIYTVEAEFGNHGRPQTAIIASLTEYFEDDIAGTIMKELYKSNAEQEESDLKLKYTTISTGQFMSMTDANLAKAQEMFLVKLYNIHRNKYGNSSGPLEEPVRSQIIADFSLESLTASQMVEAWNQHISTYEYEQVGKETAATHLAHYDYRQGFSIPIAAMPMDQAKWVEEQINKCMYLSDVLNAISPTGNYLSQSVRTLQDNLRANRNLWSFEDSFVPLQLKTRVTWRHQGHDYDSGDIVIPIVLPSDITAPYQSRDDN